MKIHDISMAISPDMMVYKNQDSNRPVFANAANYETGSHYETKVTMNMHNGTHIDAPLHMVKNGSTMESYSLEQYITDAKVIDLTEVKLQITAADLKGKGIEKGDFVLFKTTNSWDDDFNYDFVFIERTAAAFLAEIGIKGVGIDSLGIERSQADHMSHITLMNQGVMILEGLRLKDIEPGVYQLIALPVKIANVEASPVRAVLIER